MIDSFVPQRKGHHDGPRPHRSRPGTRRRTPQTAGRGEHEPEDAARKVDASASKLSRLETGRRNAPIEDVAALLAVYGVTGTRRGELLDLAREAERRGWWQRNRPDFTERQRTLVSLESKASRITNFEPLLVPGLLQTGEYTKAIITESEMVPEEDIEHHMMGRMRRHSVLLREYPPEIVALVDELVLHRVIGGHDVLRRQIEHLLQWSLRPHVTIRVIPNERAHAGTMGAFAVIAQPSGPTVAFMEGLASSLFVETPKEVEPYHKALKVLSSRALDERESVELMSEVATSLDSERTEAMTPRSTRLNWRKSSYSSYLENCVEVAFTGNAVAVRDSKDPEGPALAVSQNAFTRFVRTLG